MTKARYTLNAPHARWLDGALVSDSKAKEQLHTVLALGADKALLIRTELEPDQTLQPLAVAKLFKSIIDKEKPNIVFLGKQAIDADSNQVGQLLAGLLGWPQITFCSDLELQCNREGYVAIGTREVDQGLQKVRAPLPLVITCDLRMNQPRFVSLPNLIKARKKTIKLLDAQELEWRSRLNEREESECTVWTSCCKI
ncbi:electron transfer flavoprotein subunit beta [Cyclospora cayetanensis]|uniref:Electron transfer flavoprotein subunit beta n=1 Tax=Cyclospora cayetanensis TaxID=88456 RepID=A0A1D3CV20_9EIME|nr:electron transfer flavoprotein subunit beta [Cyclospora cayetanensis]